MNVRNEPPNEITRVGGAAPPDWLAAYMEEDKSLERMDEYRILPWIKIIQSMTKQELKDEFGEGACILSPGNMSVAQKGQPFRFVPVFFFVEFCKWSDQEDSDLPNIVERSFDPTSQVALCAKDNELRIEAYGNSYNFRYVEHLNFAGFLYGDHPLAGAAVNLGFSKGEFGNGRNFINNIRLRKVPLWSQVWEFTPSFRDLGPKKKWWGLDFSVPMETDGSSLGLIEPEEADFYRTQHTELAELFEARKLAVDMSEEEAPEDLSESKF